MPSLVEQAIVLHRTGQLKQAEALYRQALAQEPGNADALQFLGKLLDERGEHRQAIELMQRSIAVQPAAAAHYHNNLGNALRAAGRAEEALASFHRAIALRPEYPVALYNLGVTLAAMARSPEAISAYRQAVGLKPDFAAAWNNLGLELAKAAATSGMAAADAAAAEQAYRKAMEADPRDSAAYVNLAELLRRIGRTAEALALNRQAVAVDPSNATAWHNLGLLLAANQQIDEAIDAYQQVLKLDPAYAVALNDLGNAFRALGWIDESIACFQRSQAIQPDANFAANLLHTTLLSPDWAPEQILHEHQRWAAMVEPPLAGSIRSHPNNRLEDRALRIGYLSADFRFHPAGRHILAVLEHHNPDAVRVVCYNDMTGPPDSITQRIARCAGLWRDTSDLSDEAVAELVRRDEIDLLVDCSLHTTRGRHLVFARKPAPVQLTYFGYPGTTGLSTIDWRISDPYLDPPGHDRFYTERTWRLPNCFTAYLPPDDAPPITPLPAATAPAGPITFGCLGNPSKMNSQVLDTWARVLAAVGGSRLLLVGFPGRFERCVRDIFASRSVRSDRIEIVGRRPFVDYLRVYDRIDLGLDTFPYNGHITTLDSLYMGVPIVTLAGKTPVARAGVSVLSNLDLADLIAQTPEQFVQIAAAAAAHKDRLAELRRTMRQRLQDSPLMDSARLTAALEAAYREMWRQWVAANR
jgi:protein O-GlcNAc transferase